MKVFSLFLTTSVNRMRKLHNASRRCKINACQTSSVRGIKATEGKPNLKLWCRLAVLSTELVGGAAPLCPALPWWNNVTKGRHYSYGSSLVGREERADNVFSLSLLIIIIMPSPFVSITTTTTLLLVPPPMMDNVQRQLQTFKHCTHQALAHRRTYYTFSTKRNLWLTLSHG